MRAILGADFPLELLKKLTVQQMVMSKKVSRIQPNNIGMGTLHTLLAERSSKEQHDIAATQLKTNLWAVN